MAAWPPGRDATISQEGMRRKLIARRMRSSSESSTISSLYILFSIRHNQTLAQGRSAPVLPNAEGGVQNAFSIKTVKCKRYPDEPALMGYLPHTQEPRAEEEPP